MGVPDFLKVDVEGFEVKVFHGLTKPVPFICFECSTPVIENCITIVEYLKNITNYEFNFVTGEKTTFDFPDWIDSISMIEYLKVKGINQYGDVYAKIKLKN